MEPAAKEFLAMPYHGKMGDAERSDAQVMVATDREPTDREPLSSVRNCCCRSCSCPLARFVFDLPCLLAGDVVRDGVHDEQGRTSQLHGLVFFGVL